MSGCWPKAASSAWLGTAAPWLVSRSPGEGHQLVADVDDVGGVQPHVLADLEDLQQFPVAGADLALAAQQVAIGDDRVAVGWRAGAGHEIFLCGEAHLTAIAQAERPLAEGRIRWSQHHDHQQRQRPPATPAPPVAGSYVLYS